MFCNLHVHDAKGSLLDSILTVKQIAEFARDNNQEAIAITNHGYMTSYVDFVKECNRCGIKPIIGNEVYEVDDMGEKCDTKEYRSTCEESTRIPKPYKNYFCCLYRGAI